MLRVLFYSAVVFQGASLNENVLPELDLLVNLVAVSCQFCEGKAAVFHQFGVRYHDVNALKFLWRSNTWNSMDDYAMNVHIFNKIDSPWGASWVLKKRAPSHYQE